MAVNSKRPSSKRPMEIGPWNFSGSWMLDVCHAPIPEVFPGENAKSLSGQPVFANLPGVALNLMCELAYPAPFCKN